MADFTTADPVTMDKRIRINANWYITCIVRYHLLSLGINVLERKCIISENTVELTQCSMLFVDSMRWSNSHNHSPNGMSQYTIIDM